jgi:hypothetical protein
MNTDTRDWFLIAASLALFLAAMTGCQEFPHPVNDEIEGPYGTAEMEIVRDEWATRLGKTLPNTTPDLIWYAGDCLEFVEDIYDGDCLHANTSVRNGDVRIFATVRPTVEENAYLLAHEMLHWALKKSGQGSDGNHEHPAWKEAKDVAALLY